MLESLLSRGFLPQELPPLFTSLKLGALSKSNAIPSELIVGDRKAIWTQPIVHNLARPGGLRRRLSIPNPGSYFRLSSVFASSLPELSEIWSKSPYSKTSPNLALDQVRAITQNSTDRASPRALSRVGARYILRADISQFYPSIYTHSIPWALHTKGVAKAAPRDMNLLGNRLDCELMGCQYGQTKGIAIGPDVSLGMAELLLSGVDKKLSQDCNITGGTRFIDDIELTFTKLSDAVAALETLERLLADLELQLNASKTRIIELPDKIESIYVTELRRFTPPASDASTFNWIDYFNRAFVIASQHPQDGVLRYAVAALQGTTSTPKAWPLVQSLLWQCVALDPGCMRFVVDVLLLHNFRAYLTIDISIGKVALNELIQSSAHVGHGSEIVWCIWAALVLKLPITSQSQVAISAVNDPLVATAAMKAKDLNFFESTFESPLWGSWFVDDCFNEENWLFVYEATRRKWHQNDVARTQPTKTAIPTYLQKLGITFLDDEVVQSYVPKRLFQGGAGGGGGY